MKTALKILSVLIALILFHSITASSFFTLQYQDGDNLSISETRRTRRILDNFQKLNNTAKHAAEQASSLGASLNRAPKTGANPSQNKFPSHV